jgi:putative transposase
LVRRIQGYLKTTIQAALAKLLKRRQPKTVVIEELLFAGQEGNLSRRMNRLLRRFGQAYFTTTLEQQQELYGFELVKVDPAYTSQECYACGFVHPNNRHASKFK